MQHSGLGRRWLAVREDEDVAQALGIALVRVKLSAYTMGAAFAGLAGGIFAGMVGSVFPQSFQLLVSVNVLAILVVGGIGSLPGVLIGAAALIGGAGGAARPGRVPLPDLRPGDHRRGAAEAGRAEPEGDPAPGGCV